MDLNNYRKVITTRLRCMGIFTSLYGVFLILVNCTEFFEKLRADFERGFLQGFLGGMCIGLIGLCVVRIFIYGKAIRDDSRLEKLYNAEFDERLSFIKQRCGAGFVIPMAIVLTAAAVIFGYFNSTVSVTLLAVAVVQLTSCLVLKIYYSKKY